MEAATLSSKYQIVIPKAIRDRLHLNPGQRFVFVTKGDVISLVPLREMDQLRGIAKGADTAGIRDRSDVE
ncbi:AbrB/MazE/SpoVT family DNA-binding domain-containing protein [Endothiovibrio diazotrophicus]